MECLFPRDFDVNLFVITSVMHTADFMCDCN